MLLGAVQSSLGCTGARSSSHRSAGDTAAAAAAVGAVAGSFNRFAAAVYDLVACAWLSLPGLFGSAETEQAMMRRGNGREQCGG